MRSSSLCDSGSDGTSSTLIRDPQRGVMADPENREALAFLVSLPPQPAKTVRVNVTMPEAALRRINAWARSHKLCQIEVPGVSQIEVPEVGRILRGSPP